MNLKKIMDRYVWVIKDKADKHKKFNWFGIWDTKKEAEEALTDHPKRKLEVCKKHYKLLLKLCPTDKPHIARGIVGQLYGIPVRVRPYLKKLRIYTENNLSGKGGVGEFIFNNRCLVFKKSL